MKKIFISYSSKDRSKVQEIKASIDRLDKYKLWFDQEAILPGGYYAKDIANAIRNIDVFLLVVSQYSVGDKTRNIAGSDEVANELALARAHGALIIPIKLDGSWINTTTHAEFEYLMARSQWLETVSCQSTSDYDAIAKLLEKAIDQGEFRFDSQHTLDEIDVLLKQGEFIKAETRINNNVFPESAGDRLILMNTIIDLSKKPLKNFSQQFIDERVSQISLIKNDALQPFKLYLLGVLSHFFYQRNALVDPTGGIATLKNQAKCIGKLKPKYILMTEKLLPNHNGFASMWLT